VLQTEWSDSDVILLLKCERKLTGWLTGRDERHQQNASNLERLFVRKE